MFGSLVRPIPIFDIPCAAMNRIVYEGGPPPVMLGGWSFLFLLYLVIFLGERCGDFINQIRYFYSHRNTEQPAKNKTNDRRLF